MKNRYWGRRVWLRLLGHAQICNTCHPWDAACLQGLILKRSSRERRMSRRSSIPGRVQRKISTRAVVGEGECRAQQQAKINIVPGSVGCPNVARHHTKLRPARPLTPYPQKHLQTSSTGQGWSKRAMRMLQACTSGTTCVFSCTCVC